MRFLYYPIYSNPILKNCSTVNWAKAWFRMLNSSGRKYFCHWVIPKETDTRYFGWKKFDDGLPIQNVKYLPLLIPNKQYNQKAFVDSSLYDMFGETTGKHFISAILVESGFVGLMVRKLISEFNVRLSFQHPVFLSHGFFMSRDKGIWMSPDLELGEVLGMSMSYNIFATQGSMETAHKVARQFLSPSAYGRVIKNSIVLPTGVMCEELDVLAEQKNKESFLVHYSSRCNSTYNTTALFDIMDDFFQSGANTKFVMTIPNKPSTNKWGDRPYIDLFKGLPKNIFYKKMSQSHAFLADMSQVQEFSMAIGEMMYSGLVGVFKRCDWAKAFLPEGYPYLYNSNLEAVACLRKVKELTDSGEIKGFVDEMKKYIRDNYSLKTCGIKLFDYMVKTVENHRVNEFFGAGGVDDLCKMVYEAGIDNFTFNLFAEDLPNMEGVRLKYDIRNKVNRSGLCQSTFYHTLLRSGYMDTCEYEFPKFRKIKKEEQNVGNIGS